MKTIKKNRKSKGFTLIELIVVVSIILILSSFLVPKVLGYQDKAKKAKVVNMARQIFDTSMESYTEDEGVLSAAKLSTSISAVTGLDIGTANISLGTNNTSATITFNSDSKTYNVVISANDNKFSVNEGTGTTNPIYTNKVTPASTSSSTSS